MTIDKQALELTVHSTPDPQSTLEDNKQTRYGRWKMLSIWLVCAAPVLASYFTFYVIKPTASRNYGDIISPPRALPLLSASTPDKQVVQLQSLKGQWLFISVAGGACNATCENHLYIQRQIRESLGKDKDRLDWIWFINDDAVVNEALKPALKEAVLIKVPQQALSQWLEAGANKQLSDHLYLVDPQGHWMMRFNTDTQAITAKKIKQDIDRLLRASGSWDKAGR